MSEDINIVYEINTNKDLILTSFFNGLEIGKTNAGNIEKILFKVKLYDEEYNNLINQNKLMFKIQEDYETKDKEIERLHSIIKEVREKINATLTINSDYVDYDFGTELLKQELLEILGKVEDK